jgi:tRNA(Ile2) C34 agmatinyltransferase TiaS
MKDVICPICGTLMKETPKMIYVCPKCKYKMDSLNYRNIRKE